jgi:hypothetical protein
MYNLKNVNKEENQEQYGVEISNRLAAMESLDDVFGINIFFESIRKNINISGEERVYHC